MPTKPKLTEEPKVFPAKVRGRGIHLTLKFVSKLPAPRVMWACPEAGEDIRSTPLQVWANCDVHPVLVIPMTDRKSAESARKFWAMSESERVSAITAIIEEDRKPGPFCRDCADNDGVCPGTGKACDPHERLARAVLAAIEGARK